MFFTEYLLALIANLFKIAFAIVTAIPFTIAWNNLAPKYLYFIHSVYHHIPYWHVVGIFIIIYTIGDNIAKLIPSIVTITQKTNKK